MQLVLLELDLAGRLDRHAGGKVSLRSRLTRPNPPAPTFTRMREELRLKLVVVELPAKAKTIEKYLGPGTACWPATAMSATCRPRTGRSIPTTASRWTGRSIPTRRKQLKAITDAAKKADTLILATDPDREGEAISWHVQEVLRQEEGAAGRMSSA